MQNKYKHLLEKLQNADFFTFKFLESEVGESYAKLLVHNLERSGKIVKLAKGIYTFKKSPYMLVKALPKSYIGLGSAAFYIMFGSRLQKLQSFLPTYLLG